MRAFSASFSALMRAFSASFSALMRAFSASFSALMRAFSASFSALVLCFSTAEALSHDSTEDVSSSLDVDADFSLFLRGARGALATTLTSLGSTETVSTSLLGGSIITTSSSSSIFSGFTFTSNIVLNIWRNSSRVFGGSAPESILAWYVFAYISRARLFKAELKWALRAILE